MTEQIAKGPPARLTYPFAGPPPFDGRLEVAPGVFWLARPLGFNLARINLWLIRDGEGWTLVDTGMADKPTLDLWENADAILEGRPIKRIICTHMHPDHIGCAGVLSRRFDAPLRFAFLDGLGGIAFGNPAAAIPLRDRAGAVETPAASAHLL